MSGSNSSSLGSMSDVSGIDGGEGVANALQSSNKQQRWGSSEQAENLLADISSLLGDEAEKEEENVRRELEAKANVKAEAKTEEERQLRLSGDQRLKAERDRQLENEKNRDMITAAIEREEKIKRGEIDVEEEARFKREEEALLAAEARAKAKDEAALSDAQKLIQAQQSELRRLSTFNMPAIQQVEPIHIKTNPAPMIISMILLLTLVAGGVWFIAQQKTAQITSPPQAIDGNLFASADGTSLIIENIESYPTDSPTVEKHNISTWVVRSTGEGATNAKSAKNEEQRPKKRSRRGNKKKGTKKKKTKSKLQLPEGTGGKGGDIFSQGR